MESTLLTLKNSKPVITTIFAIAFTFLFFTAQSQSLISTQKGQALFIYNFAKYIKWKVNPPVFVIGIYGKSEITNELTTNLKGKKIGESEIEIKTINSTKEITDCKIIFLPKSQSKEFNHLLSVIKDKDILIITEDDFADKGAGISFVFVEQKLRFKLNQSAITKSGLQASSNLLSLAIVI